MMTNEYEVTVSGPEFKWKGNLDKRKLLMVMQIAFSDEESGGLDQDLISTRLASSSVIQTRESVREFLARANPTTIPEKIAAIGLYLRQNGQETFTRDTIKEQFARASEPLPANLGRDLKVTTQFAWIAEHRPGVYYVTNTGENGVNTGFTRAAGKPTAARKPRRKKTQKTSKQEDSKMEE